MVEDVSAADTSGLPISFAHERPLSLFAPLWRLMPELPSWRAPDPAPCPQTFAYRWDPAEPDSVVPFPEDPRAGWRYRDRLGARPGAPLGPKLEEIRDLAAGREAELARKHGAKKAPPHGSMARLLKRGADLSERYQWELEAAGLCATERDPIEFGNWVLSFKPDRSAGSWRDMRAAAIATISATPHDQRELALGLLEADGGFDADEGRSHPWQADGKASDAHRRIEKRVFDRIVTGLASRRALPAASWVVDWLVAGVHTGVPPSAWATTTIEVWEYPRQPRRCFLHIMNLRSALGSHPLARSLDISTLSARAFDAVHETTRRAHRWARAGEFHARQTQVAQGLYGFCAREFPRLDRPYTLYSARSQFISNMQATHNVAAAAALIGDIVDRPAARYAKSRQAWRTDEIVERPTADDWLIEMMRRRIDYRSRRNAAIEARQALAEAPGALARSLQRTLRSATAATSPRRGTAFRREGWKPLSRPL